MEHNLLIQHPVDDRHVTDIAQDNLRMSFASFADSIGTAPTASFRMSMDGARCHKKKRRRHFFN